MTTLWPTHEAKRRLGELLERAQTEGPQIITRYGVGRAVVVSMDDYHRMCAPRHGKDLKALLLGGPKLSDENADLFFER